jgi:multidrug transporter EmrE-like cation transporter
VVVPMMGLCYVGTAILGRLMLNEPVNSLRWLGIFLILAGIFCVAHSVSKANTP